MNLAIFALHINEMFFMCNADFHISDFLVLSLVVSRLALWSQHAIDQMCAIAISLNHNRHSGRRKAKFRKAKFIGGRSYACRKKRYCEEKILEHVPYYVDLLRTVGLPMAPDDLIPFS